MKPYGHTEKDNSICGWGCCFHPDRTQRHWTVRKVIDRAKRKKARREGRKEIDLQTTFE